MNEYRERIASLTAKSLIQGVMAARRRSNRRQNFRLSATTSARFSRSVVSFCKYFHINNGDRRRDAVADRLLHHEGVFSSHTDAMY